MLGFGTGDHGMHLVCREDPPCAVVAPLGQLQCAAHIEREVSNLMSKGEERLYRGEDLGMGGYCKSLREVIGKLIEVREPDLPERLSTREAMEG